MEESILHYPLAGFDPKGEPSVRHSASGRLWLCFEFLPPSWTLLARNSSLPLGVERAFAVDAFVGVGTEIVSLRLGQIRGQAATTQTFDVV